MTPPTIPRPVLAAALGLLQPYAPDLTATALVAALTTPHAPAESCGTAADLQLLTVADVCHLSGFCRLTIQRLVKSGRLPAVRVGRRLRIRRGAFEEFCRAGGTVTAAREGGQLHE